MIEVVTQTEIDAPADAVWRLLTDLEGYAAWNPFIRDARGTPSVGERVRVRVHPTLRIPLVFHATVLAREENRELHWIGYVGRPWVASGEHWFTIERLGARRVRFAQREVFAGIVSHLVKRILVREARRGFDAMNQALKQQAEAASRLVLRRVP